MFVILRNSVIARQLQDTGNTMRGIAVRTKLHAKGSRVLVGVEPPEVPYYIPLKKQLH